MLNVERLTAKQRYDRARYQRLKAERETRREPDRIATLDDLPGARQEVATDPLPRLALRTLERFRTSTEPPKDKRGSGSEPATPLDALVGPE